MSFDSLQSTFDGLGRTIVSFSGGGETDANRGLGWTIPVKILPEGEEADSDGDGMPDSWEAANGLDSLADDASLDPDGDGISNRTEYENNLDPQQSTACAYWVSYSTNNVSYCENLDDCPLNAPEQFITDWSIAGARPKPNSIVHDVKISGSVDDYIVVDDTPIDCVRGPKSFSDRSIANAISSLQSGQFTLGLYDWPSADYAGANIAKLGEPFTVEWEWWTPMYLSGPQYVCVGATAQFTASGAAGGAFAWGVSDSDVATIGTDGLLTAVAPGVAALMVTNVDSGCAITQNVTVFSAVISSPADGEVHLVGEQVRFTAEIQPEGMTGITCKWEVVAGGCSPMGGTGESFTAILQESDILCIHFKIDAGGIEHTVPLMLFPVLPEVVRLSWINDHPLTDFQGNTPIVDPVWKKLFRGRITKNEPGVYTKGETALAELQIDADMALTQATYVEVKGIGDKESFQPTSATFHHWNWSPGELRLQSSPLYGSVNFYDKLSVAWCYRLRQLDGSWSDWIEMNQSEHVLYTVDSRPSANPLYDLGVDKACRYANGAADFLGAINTGLSNELRYEMGHTYDDFRIFENGVGQCCCHAAVFQKLVSHVTALPANLDYCWAGCSPNLMCLFYGPTGSTPSFQCQRPAEDAVEANPHFNYHVEVLCNGIVYDPSYGLEGWAPFLETAPPHPQASVFQSSFSSLPSNGHLLNWICIHGP